jgi:uncharacterized protein YndB with AHSA1/START domain
MPRTAREGQVTVHIDAPPERVWELVADLERMGEWSPECYRVQWLDGASAPAKTGARFKGSNRFRWLRWSMNCTVTEVEPGRVLSWTTMRGHKALVRWTYRFEPAGGGTDLTESFEAIHMPLDAAIIEDYVMANRDQERERAMRTTLERIKAAAEADGSSASDH